MAKTLEEYLSLPYTIVLRRDVKDEIFVARVEQLPGCAAHGSSETEALENLRENMKLWISDCLEAGDPVPIPTEDTDLPSGKWVQRVPRSLHQKLINVAKEEGVSLNQFATSVLAEAVGGKTANFKREVAVSIVAMASSDPWSLNSRNDQGAWETQSRPALDTKRRDHSLRSLVRKNPTRDVKPSERELKSGDQETHKIWNDSLVEVPSR